MSKRVRKPSKFFRMVPITSTTPAVVKPEKLPVRKKRIDQDENEKEEL